MGAYRELELLVAKIQKQLAPRAQVLHDVKLDGRRSKTKRQVDVLVREQVGQYAIQIVIDCKDRSRPVDVKGVEEFHGLVRDVGAQKGVLVCPRGFTAAAKTTAEALQLDLYSPFDTDVHKWQVKATMPAFCDYRSAGLQFGLSVSAPLPFQTDLNFYETRPLYEVGGREIGTPLSVAAKRWNDGEYPSEPGIYEVPVWDEPVMMDNGYDGPLNRRMPVKVTVTLHVERELYYGQASVPRISGFKDELSGKVITNAFTVGLLDPEEIERTWQRISDESQAPIRPDIAFLGRVLWVVP